MKPVVIGTRGSALAQAQARLVRDALKQAWPNRTFELHIIRTRGDKISAHAGVTVPLPGKGIFTAELEQALEKEEIHIAIHSLKDMPTAETAGMTIAAIPKRGDARDMLITRGEPSLAELPPQALVATGSPRRAAQLNLARPDLQVVGIRGNIDTRLRKFRETAEWSGLVLAAAGLARLKPATDGLTLIPLPFEIMLPAPGQGALALQARRGDSDTIHLVRALHDPVTAAEVRAERKFLAELGGGCLEPIAAYALSAPNGLLHLQGVAWLNGEAKPRRAFMTRKVTAAEQLGIDLAAEISR